MNRICPKCSYARQPGDDCPEWQCPSCQVAYNKADSATQVPANYGRYGTPAPTKNTSSGFGKWITLVVVVGAIAWFGKPLWNTLKAERPVRTVATSTEQPAITLYSTTWCGYCAATRDFFMANRIEYVELDIEKTTEGYEGHKKLGGGGIPVIVIGDDVMRGYDKDNLSRTLQPWLPRS